MFGRSLHIFTYFGISYLLRFYIELLYLSLDILFITYILNWKLAAYVFVKNLYKYSPPNFQNTFSAIMEKSGRKYLLSKAE
jgi:hypothetical protein